MAIPALFPLPFPPMTRILPSVPFGIPIYESSADSVAPKKKPGALWSSINTFGIVFSDLAASFRIPSCFMLLLEIFSNFLCCSWLRFFFAMSNSPPWCEHVALRWNNDTMQKTIKSWQKWSWRSYLKSCDLWTKTKHLICLMCIKRIIADANFINHSTDRKWDVM